MIEQVCLACEMRYGPQKKHGVSVLGTFNGYTIDFRLQQFRKVSEDAPMQCIDFASDEGQALLQEMHEAVLKSKETVRQ